MDIGTQAASLLKKFGYEVETADLIGRTTVYFEDESLLGFLWVDDLSTIISQWEKVQDDFVRLNAEKLRRSLLKTWNLYMVCLCGEKPTLEQQLAMASMQENFRGARKIVQSGILSETQLLRALYPLIPIQNLVALESEDPVARIRGRLQQLPANAVHALLTSGLEPTAALQEFLRAHDLKAD